MKNKWLILLKVQLSGQFRLKEKKKSQKVMIILYGSLGIMLCFYSFFLAFGLCYMKMPEVVPSYAVAITGLITLFFTTFRTNGVIFGNKDYDILMSLPVKTSTVITSRFLTMYVLNTAFTALVMMPMGLAYAIFVKPDFLFYPIWFTGMVVMPLIPTTLATLLGVLIILFSSRFKYANAVTTIASFAVVIAILVLPFEMGGMDQSQLNTANLVSIGALLLEQIHKIYPIAVLFNKAVVGYDMGSFLILTGISIGWYYLFVKLVSIGYKKMNTGLMTYHTRSDFKLTRLKSHAPLISLYKKEWKRFTSSSIYLLNMGMGVIMALLLAGGCAIFGIDRTMELFELPIAHETLTAVIPFLVIACLSMSCPTCASLSLEGKNLWIIKSLPITDFMVFQGKMLVSLTLQLPVSVLCTVLLWISLRPGLLQSLFLLVTPIVYCCFVTVFGMVMNASMPNYEWTSEATVVKQGAPAMITIFGGLLNGIVPIICLGVLGQISATMITGIFTVLEGMVAGILYMKLKKMKIPVLNGYDITKG